MTRSEQLSALNELYADAQALALKAKALEPHLPVGTDMGSFGDMLLDVANDYLPWRLMQELESEASDEAMRQENADRISHRG